MTDFKQKQMEKERLKALCELLVAECKSPYANLESVQTFLQSGADINYKNSLPLYWATKKHNFELVKFLINNGALKSDAARLYLSQICDHNYSDKIEPQFFEILDIAHVRTGNFMSLFTPYINNMAVHGRLEKLRALQKRYYLTESEIVNVIELRIIFELIHNNHDETLAFIEKHKKWIDQKSFDSAVDSGEWMVLEYMIGKNGYMTPSDAAVAKAVYDGHFEILDILISCGYDFGRKPLFLEKACRAALTKGTRSIAYLLKNGYTVSDIYLGKTIFEHAQNDKNEPLIKFLNQVG